MAANNNIIHYLTNASWETLIPLEANNVLEKLTLISQLVQSAWATPDEVQKISSKSWYYADNIKDPYTSLKACKICADHFPLEKHSRPLTLTFENGQIVIPSYYKAFLAKISTYFKSMFQGAFLESKADVVHLAEVDVKHFKTLLEMLEQESDTLNSYESDELIDFAALAHKLDIPLLYHKAKQILKHTLSQLKFTREHWDFSVGIIERLPLLGDDRKISNIVKEYHKRRIKTFETLDQFLTAHDWKITGLGWIGQPIVIKSEKASDLAIHHIRLNCYSLQDLEDKWRKDLTNKLIHLTDLTSLQELDYSYCNSLTLAEVISFKDLTGLTKLALHESRGFACTDLTRLTALQKLDLSGYKTFKPKDLGQLSHLTDLRELNLSYCQDSIKGGFEYLTSLQMLQLRMCHLSGAVLDHLKGLTHLQELDLSGSTGLFNDDFKHLSGMTSLRKLDLSLTDVSLDYLKGLTDLRELYLSECTGLVGNDLEHLSGLIHLQKLDLSWCKKLTDFKPLSHMTALTRINLQGCKNHL